MHARVAHIALELLGIFQRFFDSGVIALKLVLERVDIFEAVGESGLEFLAILGGHVLRNELSEAVGLGDRQLLDTRHILDG